MTPYQLDTILNGAAVYIYSRLDGSIYASLNDFSRFNTEPLETVRVPLTPTSTAADVLADPRVVEVINRLSA